MITDQDIKKLATVFASKEDLQKALETFATKEDLQKALETFATKEDLQKALETFATKEELQNVKEELKISLQAFATKEDFEYLKVIVHSLATDIKEVKETVLLIDKNRREDNDLFKSLLLNHEDRIKILEKNR